MTLESLFLDFINSDFVFAFIVWALLFNILYLGLKLTNFFKQKNMNLVVALLVSIIAVVPHFLGFGFDIVAVVSRFFSNLAVLIIIMVFTVLLAGLFGKEKDFFVKNGFMIFSVVFLIVINGVVYYLFPGLFTQFLSVSLLMAILSSFNKEKGIVAYLPVTFILAFFALLYWAVIDEYTLPGWIMWLGDPLIYKALIGILVFAIIIRLVLND